MIREVMASLARPLSSQLAANVAVMHPRTTGSLVLVEGLSDKAAVETVAKRLGRDLGAKGVIVVSMGGITNVGRFLEDYARHRRDLKVASLYDEGGDSYVRSAMERVGLGIDLNRSQMEDLGFFACVNDLEEELIRSLGVEKVRELVASQDELAGFQIMQNQPQWRDRDLADQLHRFIGVRSGRKVRYGALLSDMLDLSRLPRPLDLLMQHLEDGIRLGDGINT